MSMLWTSEEAAAATGGVAAGNWQASSVSIDSRTVEPGGLYVAIVGERADGHDFVAQALENGAVAALVNRNIAGVAEDRLLIVEDTLAGLEALGRQARARSNAKIIGITGSVGKTTTKECVKLMCQAFGNTYATKGNLNNHFGTPLSLANMPAGTQYGIFEMGMNHAGEISMLTAMVQPHVAVVTNVESVHIEFFENEEAIAHAKAEIFEGLSSGGKAIINLGNRHHGTLADHASSIDGVEVLTFGQLPDADVQLVDVSYSTEGSLLKINVAGHQLTLNISGSGTALVSAILVSLTVAKALGLNADQAAVHLSGFEGVAGRGQVTEVSLAGKAMWWMDDSYNASPASMRAAFEKLALVKNQQQASRSVAVLGDMLELGEQSAELHVGLAASLAEHQVDMVFTVGPLMQHLHDAMDGGAHFKDLGEMRNALKDQLQANDVVLFKGSNGSKIHQLVKDLRT